MAYGLGCPKAHGVLVPQPGIEHMFPALQGKLNLWTTRQVLLLVLIILTFVELFVHLFCLLGEKGRLVHLGTLIVPSWYPHSTHYIVLRIVGAQLFIFTQLNVKS